jgi:hypothetical protein
MMFFQRCARRSSSSRTAASTFSGGGGIIEARPAREFAAGAERAADAAAREIVVFAFVPVLVLRRADLERVLRLERA